MARMHTVGVAVMLVFAALALCACTDIAGTWESEDGDATMVFKNGNLYDGYGLASPYTLENGTLTVTRPFAVGRSPEDIYEVEFSGNEMTLRDGDYETAWVRRSGSAAGSGGTLAVVIVVPAVAVAGLITGLLVHNRKKRLAQAEAAAAYVYGYGYPTGPNYQAFLHCTGCGEQIPGHAGFCPQCGKPVVK